MNRNSKRKCRHCKELFRPDPCNVGRQKYCSKLGCRKASIANSQRRWRSKPENRDYFRGPDHIRRVQQWRKAHPGYWRRNKPDGEEALQDPSNEKPPQTQNLTDHLPRSALQDLLSGQPLVLLGLIANLTGSALQDDIASTTRRLRQLGDDILNPPIQRQGGQHGIQPPPTMPTTATAHAKTVQLGRSPPGP